MGGRTDGAEVAHEEGFLPVLDAAGHDLVGHEDGGDAAEGKDEEPEDEQAADGDAGDFGHLELRPGDDGADVHEAAKVEDDVEAAVHFVVPFLRFLEVHAVPVECVTGDEAGQEVVSAKGSANTDGEELCDIVRYISEVRNTCSGNLHQ